MKFKRGVLSIAYTHGLDAVFGHQDHVPQPYHPHYQTFQHKNFFVYSIWVNRIIDGYPLAIIRAHEHTRNGRGIYLEMLNYYESKTNLENLALNTYNIMNDLQYTWKYPGGLPKLLH